MSTTDSPAIGPREVATFPVPGAVPDTLPELIGRLALAAPDAVVVLDKGPDGATIPVTRSQLWLRTRALAHQLRERSVRAGDCIAVWLPNWSDALVWQFASAALDAHVIGINTRYNVEEVTHLLTRAQPKLVALAAEFHGLDLLERLRESVSRSGVVPSVALVSGPGQARADPAAGDVGGGAWAPTPVLDPPALPSGALNTMAGASQRPPSSDPGALAVAFTTSGSTGLPKLAAHRAAGVLAHAVAGAAAIGIGEGEVVLCALPLSGVFGYNTAMAALAAGGVCLFEPVFDADTVLNDMAEHAVSHVVGGDDLVLRLAEAWRAHPRDLSAWRWWGVADFQGRSHELAGWARTEFGTSTSGVYGSSELFALTSLWPADEPAPARWAGGGRVVHGGIQLRVVDPETGRPLGRGEEGELQFRGPNVVDAYLGDAGAAAAAFTADGWFHSGDLGVLVADGVFVYICRMGDALRLRGFLVDPAEIEIRLAEHPQVHTAKVIGVPGPDGATLAVGFVVPEAGEQPEPERLRAWCAERLARFKVPHTVHVVAGMPTTSGTNGTKIRAATLREWARRYLAEQAG